MTRKNKPLLGWSSPTPCAFSVYVAFPEYVVFCLPRQRPSEVRTKKYWRRGAEDKRGLNERQFGFQKARSSIQAVKFKKIDDYDWS